MTHIEERTVDISNPTIEQGDRVRIVLDRNGNVERLDKDGPGDWMVVRLEPFTTYPPDRQATSTMVHVTLRRLIY